MISIIVPIYNVANYLDECIRSLLEQTYDDIEILLIDDGSTDASADICDYYATIDNRVVVFHKQNGGLSSARNYGIKRAIKEYILFVDADDYIEKDSCEKFIQSIGSIKPDIVLGKAKEIHGDNILFNYEYTDLETNNIYTSREYFDKVIYKNEFHVPVWLNLYRRKFLLQNKLLFKEKIFHEDLEIFPRIFLNARTIIYMNYHFYNYRIRANSIMTNRKNDYKRLNDLNIIYIKWKKLFDNVDDSQEQALLYGMLVKLFLSSCRVYKITSPWYPKGMNKKFIIKYALNTKERMKSILYCASPKIYSLLSNVLYKK